MILFTYFLNLLAILLAHNHYHSKREDRNINSIIIYLLIYLAVYPIIAASNTTSPDYSKYLEIIDRIPEVLDLYQAYVNNTLSVIHGGEVWIIGISFIKTLFPTAPVVLYFIVFISIYIKIKVLRKHIDYYYVAIFIYMSHEVFFKEWIQIRHGLSVSLIILALFYLLENKNIKSYASIVLSILIHKIAVVFVPFYFMYRLKNNGTNLLIALLPVSIYISMTTLPLEILKFLGNYVSEVDGYFRWPKYAAESYPLDSPTLIKQYLFTIFLFIFRKKLGLNRYFYPLFSVYLLSTHYFVLFSPFALFAARAGASLYFSEAILMAIFVSMYKNKKYAIIAVTIYGSVLFLYNYLRLA